MSTLAVVIPLYNHAAYLRSTLASVYAQTLAPQRVIVIDDGSQDDSFALAQSLARPGTEVLRQENRGAHHTLNRGVEWAAGADFVAILNSDDVWEPERLARCVAVLEKNREAQVVVTGLHLIDGDGTTLPATHPKERRNRAVWERVLAEDNPLLSLAVSNFAKTTSNVVARREFLVAHPLADLRYVHDYRFFLEAACRGVLLVVPEDLLGYRTHEGNTIKADGRRPVVSEVVQMHLDWIGSLERELMESESLRGRLRLYVQRLLGNHTDFRGEIFLQVLAGAVAQQPDLFRVNMLGEMAEFTNKS